ncbi:MAG: thiamine diphosphokinase [Oscillospiraceae bacterium]|jgi:thiamine pyrophosphokinase|nr:thiamine diphosphokinase [Oscillospiraceae bacterium]
MRAVIISGGRIDDYGYIKKQLGQFGADLFICADRGYSHAVKLGLAVSVVVGDFDSAGDIPAGVRTVRYPAEKNHTDTELALAHAREAGARELLIVGATGGRADHMLANIFLIKSCLERGEDAEIIDEHNRIKITETRLEIKGGEGVTVSLVPLCDCVGVTTEGFRYPLMNEILRFGEGRGVSNVMTGETAQVSLKGGTVLVITARD